MEKSGLWRAKKEMLLMIITTTPSVEGRTIREYKGVVFGEVISGVNIFRDFGAGLSNIFGGRSAGYEEELQNARFGDFPEAGLFVRHKSTISQHLHMSHGLFSDSSKLAGTIQNVMSNVLNLGSNTV